MGYPLEFTGIYKTQMNVELGGVSLIIYYNLINMVVDLLGNFGFYGNTSYEYFCKSENMYCFSLSDVSVILPNTPNNVVNDVSLTDQYDQRARVALQGERVLFLQHRAGTASLHRWYTSLSF